jgi:uncharacterized membrane protein YqjE
MYKLSTIEGISLLLIIGLILGIISLRKSQSKD